MWRLDLPGIGKVSVPHLTGWTRSGAVPVAGMVGVGEEVAVLSDHEQRVWDDIERFWAEDAEEPPAARAADVLLRSTPRELDDAPVLVIGSFWAAILLVLLGVHAAGLALLAAAATPTPVGVPPADPG